MIDLLIRLQQVEDSARVALRGKQLTPSEVRSAYGYVALVREIIPNEVRRLYDQMKHTDSDLLGSRELFAMGVLVATYRTLSPRKRKKLLNHFASGPRPPAAANGLANGYSVRADRRRLSIRHRLRAARN
jgi:hypothetical protein